MFALTKIENFLQEKWSKSMRAYELCKMLQTAAEIVESNNYNNLIIKKLFRYVRAQLMIWWFFKSYKKVFKKTHQKFRKMHEIFIWIDSTVHIIA